MTATLVGTVKFARDLNITIKKTNEKQKLFAVDIVDRLGTTWACQMWSDNPNQAALLQMVDSLRWQTVQVSLLTYAVRPRDINGKTVQQVNFVIGSLDILDQAQTA